jgi:endonuclease YncB( thermonuclease family)
MTGVLVIDATVDVAQFWPSGESDADTVKLTLSSPGNAFLFRSSPGAPAVITHAFDKAGLFETVKGKRTFKPLIRNGVITTRLQGIDAPELHYLPRVKGAHNFRQFQGETCTVSLGNQLQKGGQNEIPCQFVTAVNHPQDVIDKYGRFVGEIIFDRNTAKEWNICDWLVEQGWAFPAFYNSMSIAEITRLQTKAVAVQKAKRGIWAFETGNIGTLDFNMLFRRNGPIDAAKDRGPVTFPKIFRRLCDYSVKTENGTASGSLTAYLRGLKPPDLCYRTLDFLKSGGHPTKNSQKKLAQFVTAGNKYIAGPADLVFQEAPSTIVGSDNQKISGW